MMFTFSDFSFDVSGAEQARRLLGPRHPTNELIDRWQLKSKQSEPPATPQNELTASSRSLCRADVQEPECGSNPAPAQPQGNYGLIDVADAAMHVNVPAANTLQS
jgi:hypothetical protein